MYKLSVSNLAWPADDEAWCLSVLRDNQIHGIEIAPYKTFGSWGNIDNGSCTNLRDYYRENGLVISSFQAITYGLNGLSIIGAKNEVKAFESHMCNISNNLSMLGAEVAVLGSPGLRSFTDYNNEKLTDLFQTIARCYEKNGVTLVIEAVPEYYGCGWLNKIQDSIEFVLKVNSSSFQVHLDTACQYLSGETDYILKHPEIVSKAAHAHISNVDLTFLTSITDYNKELSGIIKAYYNGHWVVLEMNAKNYTRPDFSDSIKNFADLFQQY